MTRCSRVEHRGKLCQGTHPVLVSIVASILDNALGLTFVDGSSNGFIGLIASLALLLPTLAVAVRRLHDTDKTGWWLLIALVPIVGAIVLIVFFVLDSTPGANRFGPSPKG